MGWDTLFTLTGAAVTAASVAVFCVKLAADKYLGPYLDTKAKNFANKEDIKTLQRLVEMNTTVAKGIEQALNMNYTVWQSGVTFMQRQLDEFYYPLRARLTLQTQLDELWNDKRLPDAQTPDFIDGKMRQIDQDNYNLCLDIIYNRSSLVHGDKNAVEFIQFVTGVKIFNLYTSVEPYCVPTDLGSSKMFENFETDLIQRLDRDIGEIESKLQGSKAPRPLAYDAPPMLEVG